MSGLLGAVLAGGDSRRFGAPKAEADLGGLTLAARALRAVSPVSRSLALAGWRGPGSPPPGVEVLRDLRHGGGPLAGLEAALTRAREIGASGVLLLACDLPGFGWPATGALVRRWRAAAPDGGRAAVLADPDGLLQPLAGVYGVALLPGLSAWLDETPPGSGRGARAWVASLEDVVVVPAAELATEAGLDSASLLDNVNRPADGARAAACLDPLPPLVAVVGWKDSGKTTVAVGLARELGRRGLRVVAFKHGHGFQLDTPGTDSWRLRHEGGAARVVLAGPDTQAVVGDWGPEGEPSLLALARRYAADADLVVAEGWKEIPVPAIEVRRQGEPLHQAGGVDRDRYLAVVGEGEAGDGEPHRVSPDDPRRDETLAGLVVRRLLPDRAAS